MAKLALNGKSRYSQGIFTPKNPHKYVGEGLPRYRSSWEKKLMKFLDDRPSVLMWNSEDLIVKYISPLDGKFHRYHIDFVAKMKTRTGEEKTYAIEVKPDKETRPPKTKSRKRLILETETFLVNQAKWKAASEFCLQNGMHFIILNEYDLAIK